MTLKRFRFPHTSAALSVATTVFLAAVFLDIDLLPGIDFMGIDPSEAGEVAVSFVLVVPAFLVDRLVSRHREYDAKLESERMRVVRVTMRTVQDIVNNALNQLQLIRLESDGHVPQDVVSLFDDTIEDTSVKLKELGALETYVETQMAAGTELGRRTL